ncbi:MAG: lipopolysaccharide biosynthesis protein [Bacteroidetes bacterium]|nr:MAG: lipopolysaccharide biosynthesis protein [Bacteroidota bacterium]TAF93582.1 MAG: lipopolysaccharide biosynthesis protein [Bacteroidota bacterium]
MLVKLLQKLQNKHFLSLAGNGIMAILSVVTVAILYRNLTPNDIGSWVVFQTAYVLVDTFRTGFLQTALINFYAGAQEARAKEVVGSTWYLGIVITGISLVVSVPGWLLLPYITNEGLYVTVQWFFATFFCTLPVVMATWVLQAEHRFDRILYVRLVNQGSFIIMVLILIYLNKINIQWVMFVNVLGCFFTLLLVMLNGWAKLPTLVHKTKAGITEIFHFGKYSVGTTISANLLRSSDTFIINALLGPAAVAIYNLPQRLLEIIEIPLRSFLATGMPEIAAAENMGDKVLLRNTLYKYAGILTILIIPVSIGAVILADVGVGLLGGSKYLQTEAANLFRIFMVFAFLFPIDRFVGITLDVVKQPKLNFIKVLLMLVVNVIGDFTAIYFMKSVYGVAVASIPTFVVGVCFGYFSLRKFLPITFSKFFSVGYVETKILLQKTLRKS